MVKTLKRNMNKEEIVRISYKNVCHQMFGRSFLLSWGNIVRNIEILWEGKDLIQGSIGNINEILAMFI